MVATKKLVKYLRQTSNMGILLPNQDIDKRQSHVDSIASMPINVYTDSDFAGCKDTRKSTSECLFTLEKPWLRGNQNVKASWRCPPWRPRSWPECTDGARPRTSEG